MKSIAIITILGLLSGSAFADPVIAQALETAGSVSGAGKIQPGTSVQTGPTITTGAASRLSFRAFPGATVSFAASTRAAINRIELDKKLGTVSREASFRLEEGKLFFGIDKVNWNTTHFEVVTPDGKVLAVKPKAPKTATAGIVEVRHGKTIVATEAGIVVFSGANGKTISVDAGSILTSNASGYQVVSLTTGQIALYDASFSLTGNRTANAAEMLASTGIFNDMVQLTTSLITNNVIDPGLALAVRETLNMVNQELVALGYNPIDGESVGSLPSYGDGGALPAQSGFSGLGSANPANVTGNIKSPEH